MALSKSDFIKEVARCVAKYAPQFDILVYSPIIAQACLECGYGTSYKAVNFNNILGLKYRAGRVTCNNGYFEDGGSEQNPDGTYTILPTTTAWYSFESIEMCVLGYFQFTNISNYAALKGETDPYQYLVKIRAANYATSLNYVQNVYNTLVNNNLTKYDPVITTTHRVAIDAGHGSNTAGKRHVDGYREHYSNVYVSYYLEQILRKNNIETLKVSWDDENAHDDTDVALTARQAQIKSWGAEIAVSIHANAHGDGNSWTTGQGVETLYHSVNSRAGDSLKLANYVQAELIKGTVQKNRGVKRQALSMCNCTAMGVKAAVLVECAFMTNKNESELLKSDNFCRECAKEIAQGIFNYLGVNGNVNVALTAIDYPDEEEKETTTTTGKTGDLSDGIDAGDIVECISIPFYASSNSKTVNSKKTGKFYVWSAQVVNGRVRMTNSKSRVGVAGQITGWADEKDLLALVGKDINTNSGTNTSTSTSVTVAKATIKSGAKGDNVKVLQENLNKVINAKLTVDGSFGAKTLAAVKKFQTTYKLTVDGVYGPKSEAKMKELLTKKPASSNTSTSTSKNTGIKVVGGKYYYDNIDYSAVFNPVYYCGKYTDIKNVIGTNPTNLFTHFVNYGMNEGRQANANFNVINYQNRYSDLRNAFKGNLASYYKHYCEFGVKEGRNAK